MNKKKLVKDLIQKGEYQKELTEMEAILEDTFKENGLITKEEINYFCV
jgi:hypothetical protein